MKRALCLLLSLLFLLSLAACSQTQPEETKTRNTPGRKPNHNRKRQRT